MLQEPINKKLKFIAGNIIHICVYMVFSGLECLRKRADHAWACNLFDSMSILVMSHVNRT